MIQRIQTLYLLLAGGLLIFLFFFPFARFLAGTEEYVIRAFGIFNVAPEEKIVPTIQMGILLIICTLLPLVNIFFYKRRLLQMRLCIVEIVLLLGLQVYIGFYILRAGNFIAGLAYNSMTYSIIDIFPIISIIFSYLAFRGVVRDAALIKSLNRIR